MVMINKSILFFCAVWLLSNHDALSQETPGTIRGAVFDKDLTGPLAGTGRLQRFARKNVPTSLKRTPWARITS
jgi:hypothetical protein